MRLHPIILLENWLVIYLYNKFSIGKATNTEWVSLGVHVLNLNAMLVFF